MDIYNSAKGKHVLVLDGYCKQCLPFIRSFKNFGCEVTVLCSSKMDCAYASRIPDRKILIDFTWESPKEMGDYILRLISTGYYDIVYPLFDLTVQLLAHNKKEMSKYAYICVNDKEIFDRAFNKNEVMRVCMENDIPCPRTLLDVKSIDEVIEKEISFPLIIKPHSLYGARGFHIFRSENEMREYVEARGINLNEYVVQEFIPEGSHLMGANIYVDRDGVIKSSYLYICEHIYPENGGTSTLNGILIRPDITEYCNKLVQLMNLRGEIGIDLMLDVRDNVGKVIEINVRPVHGVSVGFFFGVDHAQQVLEDALGLPVTKMEITKTDTAVRILQTDALWYMSSPDRFIRTPKKLGYKHVKEQMFFWDDPLPWFAFLLDGMKNYKKKMLEKTQ